MWILIDQENDEYHGPFTTEESVRAYAKANDWGPEEGTQGRFGGGWAARELVEPEIVLDLERGTGPNAYPPIIRDESGRPTDVG